MWNKNRCMIYSTSVHNRTPNMVKTKAKLGDRWLSAMAFARFHTKTGPQTAGIIHHFVRVIRCSDKQTSQLSLDMLQINFLVETLIVSQYMWCIRISIYSLRYGHLMWSWHYSTFSSRFVGLQNIRGCSKSCAGRLGFKLSSQHPTIRLWGAKSLSNVMVTLRDWTPLPERHVARFVVTSGH